MRKLLRFRDLVALGVVCTRPTLQSWIKHRGFPPGRMVGANTRVWAESDVQAWLDQQPTGKKPVPRSPGRPHKNARAEA